MCALSKQLPGLECPFDQCGKCLYVGDELRRTKQCSICGVTFGPAYIVWPQVNWVNATEDIAWLHQHKKLELLTIALAAYFECLLYSFLKDAMWFIHEPTRVAGRCERPDVRDSGDRFVAEANECRRRMAEQEKLFKKYQSWPGRLSGLCKKLFGAPFDDIVGSYYKDAGTFFENRKNIHQWRNVLLHRGTSLNDIWSDEQREVALKTGIEFVHQCWDVFRCLYNQQIHKPWFEEQRTSS